MAGTAGSLLVVDDSSDFRSLYNLWLEERYDVRTAADGVEALDRMDEGVDVVVLDREMPRKDGLAVARELAAGAFDPAVVMVSGVEPNAGMLDVPVDDYLTKPVTQTEVLDAVERAMRLRECATRRRRQLAIETRLEVVRAAAGPAPLVDSAAYDRVRAALDTTTPTPGHEESDARASPTIDGVREFGQRR